MKYIKSIVSHETNEFANPRFANNGGGYSQPEYKVEFSDGEIFKIQDTSCGDFGSRVFVEGRGRRAYYGSMLDEEYTTFSEEDFAYLRLIYEKLGYRIPCERGVA